MNYLKRKLLAVTLGSCALVSVSSVMQADTLSASYFSMSSSDPDVANNQGVGALLTTVGAGLGPNGLPVVNTSVPQGAQLHDVNSVTHELEWWSPSLDSHVTVLNNPYYTSQITLPYVDNDMYTNTTNGTNGNDGSAYLTSEYVGQFTMAAGGSVNFNVCSDDDEFVYISGGAFGNGTLVVDNGGIHGVTCSGGNENTSMLTNVAAGTYTLTVFYDDRDTTGAAFQFSSTMDLTPPSPSSAPEPASLPLLGTGLGLAAAVWAVRKRVLHAVSR